MQSITPVIIALKFLAVLALASLVGCSEERSSPSAKETSLSLTAWLDEQYEEQVLQSPLLLTYLGRSERKDELDEFSFDSFKRDLTWQAASVAQMEQLFDRDSLSDSEKLSYDLWKYSFNKKAADESYFYNGLVFDQMNGLHAYLPTFLINFHTIDSVDDFTALISRINLVKARMDDAIDVARQSSQLGVVTPYFAMDGVIDQSVKIISGQPFDADSERDSALWAHIKRELAELQEADLIDKTQSAELESRARAALINSFAPAYEAIIAWATAARTSSPQIATGIESQPGGADVSQAAFKNAFKTFRFALERGMLHA